MQLLMLVHDILSKAEKKSFISQSRSGLYLQFFVSEPQSAPSNVVTDPRQPCWCIDARDLIVGNLIIRIYILCSRLPKKTGVKLENE